MVSNSPRAMAGCGAVHRSPPASPEGRRLVFTLDEAQRSEEAECMCGEEHH